MKILFICGAGYVSGLEVVTIALMKGLRNRGHEVRCVTSTWGDGDFAARLEASQIPCIRLPLGFISKKLSWSALKMTLDQIRKLPQLWVGYYYYKRDYKPDIIIHSNIHHILVLWLFLSRPRNFYHVHNCFPVTKFYRLIFWLINLKMQHFVGVSKYVANSLTELGIIKSKVSFVHNGTEITSSANAGTIKLGNAVNGKYEKFNPSKINIGIIGQIGEWKGHDDLLEALCLIKNQSMDFVCSIFGRGDGVYIRSLKEKLRRCELSEHVNWAGFIKENAEIFSAIDICVIPSRFEEPFGMVAVESATFGIPVIATRKGGLQEIVFDEKTGFLVEAGAPNQIAEKLILLMRDHKLRRKLGSAARAYSLENFTLDVMVEKMECIFRKEIRADVTGLSN